MLTDIISLIRFATGQAEQLEPFRNRANQLFELWIGRQKNAGRAFTDEQMEWLRLIRDHIAANAAAEIEDLKHVPAFTDRGGLIRARQVFGSELDENACRFEWDVGGVMDRKSFDGGKQRLPSGWQWSNAEGVTSYVSRGRAPKYSKEDGVVVINQNVFDVKT